MKNIVILDFDSEREKRLIFHKPDSDQPTSVEEATKLLLDDISVVFDGLCTLIESGEKANLLIRNDLIQIAVDGLLKMKK